MLLRGEAMTTELMADEEVPVDSEPHPVNAAERRKRPSRVARLYLPGFVRIGVSGGIERDDSPGNNGRKPILCVCQKEDISISTKADTSISMLHTV